MINFRISANLVKVLALAAFLLASIQTASAEPQWTNCDVINYTDRTVVEVYICAADHDINTEGNQVFTGDSLKNGEGFTFQYNAEYRYYDLRAVFDNGEFVDWNNMDCENMSKITLLKEGADYRAQVD